MADIFTVEQAAAFLGVKAQWVRMLLRAKTLAGQKLGRDWIVTREALEDYRRNHQTKD